MQVQQTQDNTAWQLVNSAEHTVLLKAAIEHSGVQQFSKCLNKVSLFCVSFTTQRDTHIWKISLSLLRPYNVLLFSQTTTGIWNPSRHFSLVDLNAGVLSFS